MTAVVNQLGDYDDQFDSLCGAALNKDRALIGMSGRSHAIRWTCRSLSSARAASASILCLSPRSLFQFTAYHRAACSDDCPSAKPWMTCYITASSLTWFRKPHSPYLPKYSLSEASFRELRESGRYRCLLSLPIQFPPVQSGHLPSLLVCHLSSSKDDIQNSECPRRRCRLVTITLGKVYDQLLHCAEVSAA